MHRSNWLTSFHWSHSQNKCDNGFPQQINSFLSLRTLESLFSLANIGSITQALTAHLSRRHRVRLTVQSYTCLVKQQSQYVHCQSKYAQNYSLRLVHSTLNFVFCAHLYTESYLPHPSPPTTNRDLFNSFMHCISLQWEPEVVYIILLSSQELCEVGQA